MKSYEKFSDRVNPDHDKEFDSRVSKIATGIISEYSPINNDVADCFEKYIAEIRPDHQIVIINPTKSNSSQGCLLLAQSLKMWTNFISYGSAIYYTLLHINMDSSSMQELKIGMVYTYTFEMTIAIIAYFAVQLSNEEDIGSMVLVALLTMYNGKSNKLGQQTMGRKVTFYGHNLRQTFRLEKVFKEFLDQGARKENVCLDSYIFVTDLRYLPEKLTSSKQVNHLLSAMMLTEDCQLYAQIVSKLMSSLREDAIEWLPFQYSNYFCASQIVQHLGFAELAFKKLSYSHHFILGRFQEKLRQRVACVILTDRIGTSHEIVRGVSEAIDEICRQQDKDQLKGKKEKVDKIIGDRAELLLMERLLPQIRLIKWELSTPILQLLFKQLLGCYQLEARPIEDLNEGLATLDENRGQFSSVNLKQLQFLVTANTNSPLFNLVCKQSGVVGLSPWRCDCNFFLRYGIPCSHELKVCIITRSLIKPQIRGEYCHEEYYPQQRQHRPKRKVSFEEQSQVAGGPMPMTKINKQQKWKARKWGNDLRC